MAPGPTFTIQQDSVDLSQFVSPVKAFAAYVGGNWPNWSLACTKWPNARRKSIAISAFEDADILDIENGDATPDQFPEWFHIQRSRGHRMPGAYSSLDNFSAVFDAARKAGIKDDEWVRWQAHYDGLAEVPAAFHAKQYTNTGWGHNLDLSACLESFWAVPSPVTHNPTHYAWFDGTERVEYGIHINERELVVEYDRLRKWGLLHHRRLDVLRRDLLIAADRVLRVAENHGSRECPNWKPDHLGYRRQQLIHRAQGQRFV